MPTHISWKKPVSQSSNLDYAESRVMADAIIIVIEMIEIK
jgi:hypothetical protein